MEVLELWMLAAASLILLAILMSKLSVRLGIPVVVLFLAIGMFAGSDGPGNIAFDDYETARAVGIVALAYILFDGGFATVWPDVRPMLRPALSLATVGVLVTAAVVGGAATWLLDLPAKEGLLLGAIVSSTDAAAIFAVIRGQGARIPARVRGLVELESGTNDPMAVFLTIGMLDLITHPDTSLLLLGVRFVAEMGIGAACGLGAGAGAAWIVNRIRLDHEGLYPVLTLAMVALTFAGTDLVGGSGFLAVYVAGLRLGNSHLVHRGSLQRFHDALAWLLQIGMFLVLGLLVFPTDLDDIALRALGIAGVLVFVARPAAAFLALLGSRLPARERALVAWLGLRGAVPIVLATFPVAEGIGSARLLFDVVFFVVLVSVLVQGTTIGPVARLLDVTPDTESADARVLDPDLLGDSLHEIDIDSRSRAAGRALVDLRFPKGVLVVLVARGGFRFVPEGSTVIRAGDRLLVAADEGAIENVRAALSAE